MRLLLGKGKHVKEEIEKNKSVKCLGPLTLDLAKKLVDPENSHKGSQSIESLQLEDFEKPLSQYHHPDELSWDEIMGTKIPEPIDFNFLKLTTDKVKLLSTEELLKLLSGEGHNGAIHESTIQLISNEILSRQIKESAKPHWTVTPTFLVSTIAAIASIVSVIAAIYF